MVANDRTQQGMGGMDDVDSACNGGRRPPGRPLEMAEDERRERVLAAAFEVLETHGYQAASMDRVAQCSGMSKRTLYQLYPSKMELFRALIHVRLFCFKPCICQYSKTPEDELSSLLLDTVHRILRPDTLSLIRAIIIESAKAADIREIMQNLAHGGKASIIDQWLRNYCQSHGRPHEDVGMLGRQAFGMTGGELLLNGLICAKAQTTPDAVETFVRKGARMFLAGLRSNWEQEDAQLAGQNGPGTSLASEGDASPVDATVALPR